MNHHTALSALWRWLVDDGLVERNIVRQVRPPKPETVIIKPFTKDEIKLLLTATERSRPYRRAFHTEPCTHRPPYALRNQVIILILLDTGIRASELCNLKIKDVDLRNRELQIIHGKGGKSRPVYLSSRTAKLLWRYMTTSRSEKSPDEALFTSHHGLPLGTDGLRMMLSRLGEKAGVQKVHAHRFRHTFAINYLRNGGDVFTLQKLLGHSDLKMTERYLDIAGADVARRHQVASPVANWGL